MRFARTVWMLVVLAGLFSGPVASPAPAGKKNCLAEGYKQLHELLKDAGFGPRDLIAFRRAFGNEEVERIVGWAKKWSDNKAAIEEAAKKLHDLKSDTTLTSKKKGEREKELFTQLKNLTGLDTPELGTLLGEARVKFLAEENPGEFLPFLIKTIGAKRYSKFIRLVKVTNIHAERGNVLNFPFLLREIEIVGPLGRRTIPGRWSPPAPSETLKRVRTVLQPIFEKARTAKSIPAAGTAVTVAIGKTRDGKPVILVGPSAGHRTREAFVALEKDIKDAVAKDPQLKQALGNKDVEVRYLPPPAQPRGTEGMIAPDGGDAIRNLNGTDQDVRATCGEVNTFRMLRQFKPQTEGLTIENWGTFWSGDTKNNLHPYVLGGERPRLDHDWMEPCASCEANLFHYLITKDM